MKKILIITAIIISVIAINKNKEENIIIPNNAIRFRVIASSNRIEDQLNKNKISKSTQEYIYELTKNSKSTAETKEILLKNKTNIENHVKNYMITNNIKENFNINIGNNYFPDKNYKGVKYQAGYYDSVVINLGDSKGLNWWCVIYPPLCLIEEDTEQVEYTSLVSEILSKFDM